MFKVMPNPPETNPRYPYESPNSKKFHEAAVRALYHYLKPADLIMASTIEPEPMYLANPKYESESLQANASEALGSASETPLNFATLFGTFHCKTPLGIAQVVMLGELALRQALDNV